MPDVPGLRPTPSMVREAMFSILGGVENNSVLDLFSGSGLMAVEALSRGAGSVVSVEMHRKAIANMKHVCQMLMLESAWSIKPLSVEKALAEMRGGYFDLVFADPPYEKGFSEKIPAWLSANAIRCGRLVIEESAKVVPVWPDGWTCRQSRRYGDTCLHFLEPEGR